MKQAYTAVRFRRLKRSYAGLLMRCKISPVARLVPLDRVPSQTNKLTFVWIPSRDLDNIALNF